MDGSSIVYTPQYFTLTLIAIKLLVVGKKHIKYYRTLLSRDRIIVSPRRTNSLCTGNCYSILQQHIA